MKYKAYLGNHPEQPQDLHDSFCIGFDVAYGIELAPGLGKQWLL
jgi:hypothetical protein